MARRTLVIDAAIAATLTILVIGLTPGLAVVGLIAILLVGVCGVSLKIDSARSRSRRRRREPPTRIRSRPSTQARRRG